MANPSDAAAEAVDHSAHMAPAAGEAAVAEHGAETHASVEHGADAGHHAGPEALGLGPSAWVGISMLVFIVILLWKKVPGAIAGGLDGKIAAIKQQLDEAKALRAEAEALRKEYADKIANAEKDAASMIDHARQEADAIVAKAEADSKVMIERRKKMAEDKIGAEERAAVDELRQRAASAATAAASALIAEKHDAAADGKLVDEAIAGI